MRAFLLNTDKAGLEIFLEEGTMREREIKYNTNSGVCYVGKGSHNRVFFTGNRVEDHLWQALALYKGSRDSKPTDLPKLLC